MSTEALYYPYTTIRSLDSLKAMVLYFDSIHIIHPDIISIGDTKSILPEVSILEKEKIIKYIPPAVLLHDYDAVITKSMINDLVEPDFIKLCRKKGLPSFLEIYAEKIPRLWIMQFSGRYTNRRMFMREYFRPGIVRLPFEVGETLMINHALSACAQFSLTPITDHIIHHTFLMHKFRKMQRASLVKKILADYGFIKDIRIDLASVEIISETLPMLYKAKLADLLEFRDQNKDALVKFKVEMGKVITEVEGNFWDEDFHKKVIDIVDSRVKPAIQGIKDSVDSVRDRFLRILRRGAVISPLPIVANVVPGCNPAIALAVAAGILALDEYVESSIKKEAILKKNGFAYLFKAQKRFSQ